SHHWFSGMAALEVARERGVPHVQSFHSVAAPPDQPLTAGEPPESPARLDGETLLARRTDLVVAVSAAEARTVVDRLGAAPEAVRVVHPGVDSEMFHPGEGSARPTLLAAARLEPLKAIDLAIRTLAGVVERDGEPRPRLVVAGGATSDESYPRELAALAADLGVACDVTFLGPQGREQLAALMRSATLVLVPSHSETYGLVALEAAASGVPVVATRAGGLEESVVDDVTGLLLPDWETATWVDAVAGLLADPDLVARLGEGGRAPGLRHRSADGGGAAAARRRRAHALRPRRADVAEATVACYRGRLGCPPPTAHPHEDPITRLPSSTVCAGSLLGSAIVSSRCPTAVRTISVSGCRIVVSGGCV